MIKDGENLYIGAEFNFTPNKQICNCEHLKLDIDMGVPYDHEDSIKPKCNILKEKFLIFFKVRQKCLHFENKSFVNCSFYTPTTARGTL